MAFLYNTVTFSGATLLAQATSANPIVYIGSVAATQDYIDTELQQMSDPTDYRWDVQGGNIIACSATAITARIIAGFKNRASEVTIKTIGILGRLASQSDAEAVVVAAVSDPNASIRIPSTSEPPVTIETALNITISDTQSVTVTSSTAGSAMLSDLDRLVSCHKAGLPYSGENQTIYGTKTFYSTIHAPDIELDGLWTDTDRILWSNSSIYIERLSNGTYDDAISIYADGGVVLTDTIINGSLYVSGAVTSDLLPDGYGQNIGGNGSEWSHLYAEQIHAEYYSGGEFNGDVEFYDTCYFYGMSRFNGGYTLDDATPLTMSKYPLVTGQNTIQIGGIFLAIVVSQNGAGVVNSGQTIPSTLEIYKAESYSQSTGSQLTPKFSSGVQLANDGSSYSAINAFRLSGSGQQVLAFLVRVK